MKYFFTFRYAGPFSTAFVSLAQKCISCFLCSNMYIETIIDINTSNIVPTALITPLIYP